MCFSIEKWINHIKPTSMQQTQRRLKVIERYFPRFNRKVINICCCKALKRREWPSLRLEYMLIFFSNKEIDYDHYDRLLQRAGGDHAYWGQGGQNFSLPVTCSALPALSSPAGLPSPEFDAVTQTYAKRHFCFGNLSRKLENTSVKNVFSWKREMLLLACDGKIISD